MKTGRETFWFISGVFLFGLYFTLLGIILYLQWRQGQRYYWDGFNGTHEGLGRSILSFFVWLGALPIFILALLRFLKSLFKSTPRVHHFRIVLLVLILLLNPIFSFSSMSKLISHATNPSRYQRFTEGYRDWAKSVLDVPAIREWMAEQEDSINTIGSEDFDGPKCLAENHARLSAGMLFDKEGMRVLRIMSGGGFQDWGIVIGPEEMKVPESTYYKYNEHSGEYRLKLAEGAYVYYELQ